MITAAVSWSNTYCYAKTMIQYIIRAQLNFLSTGYGWEGYKKKKKLPFLHKIHGFQFLPFLPMNPDSAWKLCQFNWPRWSRNIVKVNLPSCLVRRPPFPSWCALLWAGDGCHITLAHRRYSARITHALWEIRKFQEGRSQRWFFSCTFYDFCRQIYPTVNNWLFNNLSEIFIANRYDGYLVITCFG